jgi:DNA primase catalytic core
MAGVTMSIHKLTAGSGYDYLTRQVAALDATEKGHVPLASYYTERGESPGVWIGAGLAGIDGLQAGDPVTGEQMRALFGVGLHPLAMQRQQQLQGPDLTDRDYQAVTRLGAPFKIYRNDIPPFQVELAKRIAELNAAAGLPRDLPVPRSERARVRTEVAREFFAAEHGRPPQDTRELAAAIAKHSRPQTTAVAGYDLTFSPVKSVSALWALAEPVIAARIEKAHRAAVADALSFIEQHALFSRTGANGIRQVNVQGLVAAAFTHRDSRAGDPDLHTHVAVANKVQTLDGRWLSIDGRILFKATVAASETYNTALENHLRDSLGLRFAERPNQDPRKRPIREIVGVNPSLNARWSARRASIEARRAVLAADFQRTHGRPTTPVESLQLAQQATLETRKAKHEPRSLAEQRTTWFDQAADVLGGPDAVQLMVEQALNPARSTAHQTDTAWLDSAADRVLAAMEEHRSTWQVWHVRAEAQRHIRAADVPTTEASRLVDLLVDKVLTGRSVCLARPETMAEPELLQRSDGASVYTVAGADLFTSTRILEAEKRLVATAGRREGPTITAAAVDTALLETTANGITLNAGQTGLVREMSTSGARLQLAIAPAGTGKTTAMRALATAWRHGGGTVIGLAPTAAAAAVLRDQIHTGCETLAKLIASLQRGQLPEWAAGIGPSTLVVIDEAGMADTLSLAAAVSYIVEKSGSVRLIGDDQQLSAIGAGGVLRDIEATHGAVRLAEPLRFTDPAEAAAALALREGQPEAIGFYLDSQRVHVGDVSTITEHVFAAWQGDRSTGLDSIMLAPTRELVAELNLRARTHRLADTHPATDAEVALADGNHASVGDLIITRSNDRHLRLTATDWVKNGDRWTVRAISGNGDLDVQHLRNRHRVRLPAAYVQTSVELGYATTVHGAQGLSVDTMHGLATGEESRQQLYTMLTRGRIANHLYLQVVGDGDPHSIIWPETVRPATATDLLEQILARDDAARSATTFQRDQHDPVARLGDAAQRYVDALHVAAEDLAGRGVVAALEKAAEQAVPGLTDEPAWPTLRARLLLLAAADIDPIAQLLSVVDTRELDSAVDRAAVLGWRLDDTSYSGFGPLPWLPGIPQHLQAHQMWGSYLTAQAATVMELAGRIRASANADQRPTWAGPGWGQPPSHVIEHVEVWRAAMGVSPDDRRPTGQVQRHKAARIWQRRLDQALADGVVSAWPEWRPVVAQLAPNISEDSFAPILASRLAAISGAGVDAQQLLRAAVLEKPLPDDHAAAALWWRICRHLNPAVSAQINCRAVSTVLWESRLAELIGTDRARLIQTSPWWPALVTTVDHALQHGWPLDDLISGANSGPTPTDIDHCQALLWRISIALEPLPADDGDQPHPSLVSDDAANAGDPPTAESALAAPSDGASMAGSAAAATPGDPADNERYIEADLAVAAMLRDVAGPPEQTDADVTRMFTRAMAWRECPVSEDRMVEVNQLSLAYFRHRFPSSWAQQYLADRFGEDLTDDHRFQPGQAPAGWTNLIDHLRRHGVTDEEMLISGVAVTASTGRLIDRFRDRVVFPIIDDGKVLGFVGRRRPDLSDVARTGPKYLNTSDTALFHKGAQLFGVLDDQLSVGAIPVIVEGPMDAIAVTLASQGRYIGVAPLGTSLTDEQAHQLARIGRQPIVATDADLAGRIAAERDFWILSCCRLDPLHARLPAGTDPADLLALGGPRALTDALTASQPLAERLLAERIANLPPADAVLEATRIVAARPSRYWEQGSSAISAQLAVPIAQVRCSLFTLVKEWNTDPRRAAQQPLQAIGDVKRRIAAAIESAAGQPRIAPARGLERRLHQNPPPAGRMRRTKPEGRRVPPSSRTGTPGTRAR